MVIMVITGGKGTLAGPIVGGLVFGILPDLVRSFAIKPELQWVLFGVLMILRTAATRSELRPRISPISSGVGTRLPMTWALIGLL